ncbi:MAG: hybrid sensor histidine kinase/response regulator [Candidatus Binatia bacterium]
MVDERASLLIVDDERGPAESLRMIFKPSYNVFTASSGPQALDIIRSTAIDVVTLDLRMPVMSGVEVMEHIKAFDPDVEVIIVTGYSSLDSAIRGLRQGVFDYVSKPFDVPQISDLVRRAVARRRANQRARRMKEDFLANLSHELRTPLSAIIGYSAILAEELEKMVDEDQRSALERIQANSAELLSLVESVLLLTAIDSGDVTLNLERTDAGEIVRQAAEKFQPAAAEKGLLLGVDLALADLSVVTDSEKLERVLWALLDNAVKFTQTGMISVAARRAPHTNAIEIEVADTGIGMERDEIARVMEGLSQADPSSRRRYRGLGLGLRIATRLADLMGSHLRMTSERGRGTLVTLTVPTRSGSPNPFLH